MGTCKIEDAITKLKAKKDAEVLEITERFYIKRPFLVWVKQQNKPFFPSGEIWSYLLV